MKTCDVGQLAIFAEPELPSTAPDMGLRPYQQEAREAVSRVHNGSRGALVVLPTGTGKSRLAGAIAWDHKLRGGKVLVLCPTIVLCHQMVADMRGLGLSVGLEQSQNVASKPPPDVVVASTDTMRGARLKLWPTDTFGLVVADEAHRSTSAKYAEIFSHFEAAKRLGLTATPDRTDGVALANVFDAVAYEMSMLSAIEAGWLVPLRFKTAQTDFDPANIRTVAGDCDPASVSEELVRSGCLHEAANAMAELAGDARAVAFLPTVGASKAFCVEINARHQRSSHVAQYAVHLDAKTPEQHRIEAFAAFKSGETRVLSNVGILIEGWDAPWASVIALLNPTKSRSRLCQMIGRGTRRHEGKESTLVIDFCQGRLKKGRLASPADALAGKMLDDKVFDEMSDGGDIAEEITKAVAAVERQRVAAQEIADAKAAAAERQLQARAKMARQRAHVKKKAFVFGIEDHDMQTLFGRGDVIERLSRAGVDVPKTESARRAQGLCSLKQANHLSRWGLNPNVTYQLAGKAMGILAANGWRPTPALLADKRFKVPT